MKKKLNLAPTLLRTTYDVHTYIHIPHAHHTPTASGAWVLVSQSSRIILYSRLC